jgi:LysR family nitrogen assimilation transcriptional regulator
LSRLLTVPLTKTFRQTLPQAQLTLTEGFSLLMLESLRAGRLDMALLYNPVPAPDLEMSLLFEDPLVLIAGPKPDRALKPKMSLAELAHLPLILPSRPNAFRLLIDTEMTRLTLKPHIVLEIDGLNAILELVKEGLGYAILPAYTLKNFSKLQYFSTHVIDKPCLMSKLMLVRSAHRAVTATHVAAEKIAREVLVQAMA